MNKSRISQSLRRYPLIIFFGLAIVFTWANWVPRALVSRGIIDLAVPDFLSLVAGYGPALAAIIVTSLVSGKAGLRQLFRRLVLWRVGIQWYVVVLFLPAATMLTALGLHLLFGGTTPSITNPPTLQLGLPDIPLWQQTLLLMLMFTLGFDGLGEELGWRGYALPQLLSRHSALAASLILGVVWALWHLPYALTLGSVMSDRPFYAYVPGMLASAILFTWIFNNTKGSILMAILYHAAGNVTANVLPVLAPGVNHAAAWGMIVQWAAAIAVVLFFGPAHLSKRIPAVAPDPAVLHSNL
jgi:membrane protease YdiL (CAAX protease family)